MNSPCPTELTGVFPEEEDDALLDVLFEGDEAEVNPEDPLDPNYCDSFT